MIIWYNIVLNYKESVINDKISKSIKIPLNSYKIGKNNIRFTIYDDAFESGKTRRRMSFVDKEFYIKENGSR